MTTYYYYMKNIYTWNRLLHHHHHRLLLCSQLTQKKEQNCVVSWNRKPSKEGRQAGRYKKIKFLILLWHGSGERHIKMKFIIRHIRSHIHSRNDDKYYTLYFDETWYHHFYALSLIITCLLINNKYMMIKEMENYEKLFRNEKKYVKNYYNLKKKEYTRNWIWFKQHWSLLLYSMW